MGWPQVPGSPETVEPVVISRRAVVCTAALAALASSADALALLWKTPRQPAGPFYPAIIPLDADADLVQVDGMSRLATGIITHLTGRVVDPNGHPIAKAKVEIWQCDAFGAYKHPRDRGDISEREFQGYGHTRTSRQGEFHFRTIRPVRYPGRTPHIHARVTTSYIPAFTTQFYIEGEAQNAEDFLYRQIPESLRPMVTARYPSSAKESDTVIPNYPVIVG